MPHQDTLIGPIGVRPVLREPFGGGYLHVAGVVEPTLGRTPFPRGSRRKTAVLVELKRCAAAIERLTEVRRATVYRARFIPPVARSTTRARFDVSVLVETHAFEMLEQVRASRAFADLVDALAGSSRDASGLAQGHGQTFVTAARCIRMIADVDKTRRGLYLFNYFVSDDTVARDDAVDLWKRLAGWYVTRTGLANSTLLEPVEGSPYIFINHARWDLSLASFVARQFAHPSFRTLISDDLRRHRTVSMPIFYARV